MCGLFGWIIDDQNVQRRGVFGRSLGYDASNRGHDSWGLVCERQNGAFHVERRLGDIRDRFPFQLLSVPKMLGHTRFATVGEVSVRNAHPFERRHIIGSHNGSVGNYRELNEKHGRNAQVDSEHLFEHLAQELPFTDITANGVITYLKKRSWQSIYITTLTAPSLTVVQLLVGGRCIGVAWGSLREWLDRAATISGYGLAYYEIDPLKQYIVTQTDLGEVGTVELKPLFEVTTTTSHFSSANDGWVFCQLCHRYSYRSIDEACRWCEGIHQRLIFTEMGGY